MLISFTYDREIERDGSKRKKKTTNDDDLPDEFEVLLSPLTKCDEGFVRKARTNDRVNILYIYIYKKLSLSLSLCEWSLYDQDFLS